MRRAVAKDTRPLIHHFLHLLIVTETSILTPQEQFRAMTVRGGVSHLLSALVNGVDDDGDCILDNGEGGKSKSQNLRVCAADIST